MNNLNAPGPSNKWYSYVFYLLASLLIIERVIVLMQFGVKYTGADQTILWLAAIDYSNGVFHEPYYYGQNYNFMFESLFAVPFVKLGIKPHIILPVITSIFTVTPFLVSAFLARRKGQHITSIVFLSMLLLLPNRFSLMGALPGGFMTGLFFAGFIPLAMEAKNISMRFFLAGTFTGLAFIGNPNSVLVTVPMMVYYFLENYRNYKFYILVPAGTIPFFIIHLLAQKFYIDHPDWVGHLMDESYLKFRTDLVEKAFTRLDVIAEGVSPILWNNGSAAFIIIAVCCLALFVQGKYRSATAALAALVIIIYSFGLRKVHDGTDSIFLSHTRIFIAIPFLLAVIISWMLQHRIIRAIIPVTMIAALAVVSFTAKSIALPGHVQKETASDEHGPVGSSSIEDLCKSCELLKSIAQKNNAEMIIHVYIWDHTYPWHGLRAYGCPVLTDNFPKTLFASGDLRTWRYFEEQNTLYTNLVLVGGHANTFFKADSVTGERIEKNIVQCSDTPRVFILTGNTLPTLKVLKKFSLDLRPGLKLKD